MKTHVLSFLALAPLFISPCSAQMPNAGFETWVDVGGYLDPQGWSSLNSITFPFGEGELICEQAPGASGSYCMQVTTKDVPNMGMMPGLAYTTADPTGPSGFPHTERSEALNGQWKYNIQPGDNAVITLALSRWNTATQAQEPVGTGALLISGIQADWEAFSMPIDYSSEEQPDTAVIYVISSAGAGVIGSTVSVDDFSFDLPTAVKERSEPASFLLFPSPATDHVTLTTSASVRSVSLLDLQGREVRVLRTSDASTTVDVSGLPSGTYFARMSFADGRNATRPFLKH